MIKKKISTLFVVLLLTCMISACGSSETTSSSETANSSEESSTSEVADTSDTENNEALTVSSDDTSDSSELDVDLTTLSSTMVYAEVYNMVYTPDDYVGKTVRMTGTFAIYQGDSRNYYACLIADATACCSQGIEFVLDGDYSYPDDYPELGTEITVTGTFDTYYEGDNMYVQLIDASMEGM